MPHNLSFSCLPGLMVCLLLSSLNFFLAFLASSRILSDKCCLLPTPDFFFQLYFAYKLGILLEPPFPTDTHPPSLLLLSIHIAITSRMDSFLLLMRIFFILPLEALPCPIFLYYLKTSLDHFSSL